MIEEASSGLRQLSSLVVRRWARCRRMSKGKLTRSAFAAGLALSGVLTISSTAPALLEGASPRASGDVSDDGRDLRGFAARVPTPAGLIVEYGAVRDDPDRSAAKPYGEGVPFAVRSPLADDQLFTEAPALLARSDGDADDFYKSSGNASRRGVSRSAKSRAVSSARVRKTASLRVAGCSRCAGPIVPAPSRRPHLFVSLFLRDVFRNVRFVRREKQSTGIVRQREAPRLTAWSFQPT